MYVTVAADSAAGATEDVAIVRTLPATACTRVGVGKAGPDDEVGPNKRRSTEDRNRDGDAGTARHCRGGHVPPKGGLAGAWDRDQLAVLPSTQSL